MHRPALACGSGTRETTKDREMTVEVNEMRMLQFMCGVTKKDEDAEVNVWSHEER